MAALTTIAPELSTEIKAQLLELARLQHEKEHKLAQMREYSRHWYIANREKHIAYNLEYKRQKAKALAESEGRHYHGPQTHRGRPRKPVAIVTEEAPKPIEEVPATPKPIEEAPKPKPIEEAPKPKKVVVKLKLALSTFAHPIEAC